MQSSLRLASSLVVSVVSSVAIAGCASSVDEEGASAGSAILASEALPACVAQPACDGDSAPAIGAKRPFRRPISQWLTSQGLSHHHRGRDQIFVEGQSQTLIGKFTYGLFDKDLEGEDVDVFVERGCGGSWERLGTATTTVEGRHATVDGIEDDGGRLYFPVPAGKTFGLGRHRVRMVVAGDQSSADLVVDVVPRGTSFFVSDVDGTLTTKESAEWEALLKGDLPDARADAAAALRNLAAKGIRPVYLTARPEWLKKRTRQFLNANGFPVGIISTAQEIIPAFGSKATSYKTAALQRWQANGAGFTWGFGNTDQDADAYAATTVGPLDQRFFVRHDDRHGGRRIEAFAEVLPATSAAAPGCR